MEYGNSGGRFRSNGGGSRGGFGGNRGGGGFGGPREMHDAVCSECQQPTKVPFKPAEGRPVFCRDCFMKKKPRRDE